MSKVYESLLNNIDIETLAEIFPNVKYVALATEEPLTGLAFIEVEYLLSNTKFSDKKFHNRLIKDILFFHCLGYTDQEITDGFNKLLIRTQLTYESVKKKRQRALDLIDKIYNKKIGLITLIYEKFRVIRENYGD